MYEKQLFVSAFHARSYVCVCVCGCQVKVDCMRVCVYVFTVQTNHYIINVELIALSARLNID